MLGTVELPDTTIRCQEIYDQTRAFEAQLANMDLGEQGPAGGNGLVEAAGKFQISAGGFTIISVRLLQELRLRFADRPGPATVPVRVEEGNLVGTIGSANEEPVLNSAFTYMTRALATTGAILQDVTLYDGLTFEQVLERLLSMASGRIEQIGSGPNVFEFYRQDDVTVLFTLTQTTTERTRS